MTGTSACLQVDANYKPPPPHPTAFVNVTDLYFRDVTGTDCGKPPEVVCPKQSPCRNVQLDNVNLSGEHGKPFAMQCSNAFGGSEGTVNPPSCLSKP